MIYIGFFARAILQFVSFYLIVNIFTPNDYGILTSYLAVNGLSIVFADLGAYSLTIRQISNSKNIVSTISRNIGNAIFGSIGSILFIYLASNFFRNNLDVSIILGFSSIVLQVVSATALGYAIALKSGKAAAAINISPALSQIMVSLYIGYFDSDVRSWIMLYSFSNLVLALAIVIGFIYSSKIRIQGIVIDFKYLIDGIGFAIGSVTQIGVSEIDKPLVAKYSSTFDAGVYTAGYRLITASILPLNAYLSTVYPNFFKTSNEYSTKSLTNITFRSFIISLPISIIVYFLSDYVPLVIGDEFQESIDVIKILTLVIILTSIKVPLADFLSGNGRQSNRNITTAICLVVNIALTIYLSSRMGWLGAALSTIITEILLVTALIVQIAIITRFREKS